MPSLQEKPVAIQFKDRKDALEFLQACKDKLSNTDITLDQRKAFLNTCEETILKNRSFFNGFELERYHNLRNSLRQEISEAEKKEQVINEAKRISAHDGKGSRVTYGDILDNGKSLKPGYQGHLVSEFKKFLREAGVIEKNEFLYRDPKTKEEVYTLDLGERVKKFQAEHGLPATGEVDKATFQKVIAEANAKRWPDPRSTTTTTSSTTTTTTTSPTITTTTTTIPPGGNNVFR